MNSLEKGDFVWEIMRTMVVSDDRRREVADALGMSFMRSRALRRIATRTWTLRELAANLSTDAPYVTLVVRDLEARGLVTRTVNPADGRSKTVQITEAGRHAAEMAEAILRRPPAAIRELPAADLNTLLAILRRAIST